MRFERVQIRNLRLLDSVDLAPSAGLNVIVGANATGKTSLLEALYAVARGRSFRAGSPGEMVGPSGPCWSVFAKTRVGEASPALGVGWNGKSLEVRIDEREARSRIELAKALALQIIEPGGHRLLEDGPALRRGFIDWGVFHVEHGFLDVWRAYRRALSQRNGALRQGQPAMVVASWVPELLRAGLEIDRQRRSLMKKMAGPFTDLSRRLLGTEDVRLEYQPGWPRDREFEEVLVTSVEQHRRAGTTLHGPHRAEVRVTIGEAACGVRLSRGQQKLMIAMMVLAQCELIRLHRGAAPVILVDDFQAELASEYRERLAKVLKQYPGQVFATAFDVDPVLGKRADEVFHVEQGRIVEDRQKRIL